MHNKQTSRQWVQIGLIGFFAGTLALPVPLLADDERIIRRLGDGSVETEDWIPGNIDFDELDPVDDGDSDSDLELGRIQQAQAAEANGVLLGADGAFALWLSVLNDNPQNDQAREGLTRIASQLDRRARQAFAEADAATLNQLDFDYSRFSEVPVIGALRDRMQQQIELLENRPTADQQYTLEQLSELLEKNRHALAQNPNLDWLQADKTLLTTGLDQVSQHALSIDDAESITEVLEIAGRNNIELSNQASLEDSLRSWHWQQSHKQISDWLDEQDVEQAQAELAKWEDSLPGWQALQARSHHLAQLEKLQPGDRFEPDGTSLLVPAMRYVGQVNGNHLVVAETEVTVSQYRRFVEATGYRSSTERGGQTTTFSLRSGDTHENTEAGWHRDYRGRNADDDLPVIHLTWGDTLAYIDWLNGETGLPLRLPSQEEFRHYAAGGSDTRFWWGNGLPDRVVENLAGEGDMLSANRRAIAHPIAFAGYADGHFGPAPVASFVSNPYGLHDVLGNVAEMTGDCADQTEPCRQIKVAGGHWHSAPTETTVDAWRAQPINQASAEIGFRLVMSL